MGFQACSARLSRFIRGEAPPRRHPAWSSSRAPNSRRSPCVASAKVSFDQSIPEPHHRARRIRITPAGGPPLSRVCADIYQLIKFQALEPEHLISQKPVCSRRRSAVKKGQVLADCPCTERGELALGRRSVAFGALARYNCEKTLILVAKSWSRTITTPNPHTGSTKSKRSDTSSVPRKSLRDISQHPANPPSQTG